MRSVLMVCHGNICRSPMAATLMRVMAEAAGWDDALWVDSCGVSDEGGRQPDGPAGGGVAAFPWHSAGPA